MTDCFKGRQFPEKKGVELIKFQAKPACHGPVNILAKKTSLSG
jgi:hypothetical protein